MSIEAILASARAGLNYERMRLDASSRNIAIANVPIPSGQVSNQWRVDASPLNFGQMLAPAALVQHPAGVREVHDPSHPLANEAGMVRYPDTDHVQEMTTLMTASRGYEANVRSYNLLRSMLLRALEIGAK